MAFSFDVWTMKYARGSLLLFIVPMLIMNRQFSLRLRNPNSKTFICLLKKSLSASAKRPSPPVFFIKCWFPESLFCLRLQDRFFIVQVERHDIQFKTDCPSRIWLPLVWGWMFKTQNRKSQMKLLMLSPTSPNQDLITALAPPEVES